MSSVSCCEDHCFRFSNPSIIDRLDILVQISLVAGSKIVSLQASTQLQIFMSVRGGLYKSIVYDTCSEVEC